MNRLQTQVAVGILLAAAGGAYLIASADAAGPEFVWGNAGRPPLPNCVQIDEPADHAHGWADNFLCSTANFGLRWSAAGPLAGMRCTLINEPADAHGWADNYLCLPQTSPIQLQWSFAGPVPGRRCVQFLEPKDPDTWHDNFLCF